MSENECINGAQNTVNRALNLLSTTVSNIALALNGQRGSLSESEQEYASALLYIVDDARKMLAVCIDSKTLEALPEESKQLVRITGVGLSL
jgi:hypothetical protein